MAREAKGDKTRENCWPRGSFRAPTPAIGGSRYRTSSSKVGEGVRGFSTAVSSGGSRHSKLGWPDALLFLNCCCALLLLELTETSTATGT